jgi:dipeptidase E
MKHLQGLPKQGNRRLFLKSLTGLSVLGLAPLPVSGSPQRPAFSNIDRSAINALLISATTVAGKGSLEHAEEALRQLYGTKKQILLINFASLPQDRDSYAVRMQKDFQRIDPGFRIDSLHTIKQEDAAKAVREAEAFYVSGGNTFLLLRELYDRFVVDLLRERVLAGVPYAGASAGSNIGGLCIGTTNDFPMTDIPTRESLGIFPGIYNPHHPEEDQPDFGSRQWKIRNYAKYNPDETIVGVPNAGMLHVRGSRVTLLGKGAVAFIQRGDLATRISSGESVFY